MHTDISVWKLMLDAGAVVQVILMLLFVASVVSWTVMLQKSRMFKRLYRFGGEFEERFWSGTDLQMLFKEVSDASSPPIGVAAVFEAGFRTFAKLRQNNLKAQMMLDGVSRGMRVALNREMDRMEENLGFLATVGSVSPYVGLLARCGES